MSEWANEGMQKIRMKMKLMKEGERNKEGREGRKEERKEERNKERTEIKEKKERHNFIELCVTQKIRFCTT